MTDHGATHSDLHTTLGKRLYRAGYTEPRLRQMWGGAVTDALVRNNAAPAIHRCERLLGRRRDRSDGAGTVDEDLAVLALLFRFQRTVPVALLRRALGDEAVAAAVSAGLVEIGESGERPGAGTCEGGIESEHGIEPEASAPFAITPYDLPVGVPRGFAPGDENLYLVSDHGTLVNPDVLDGDFVLGLGGAGRTLVSLTPREHCALAADIGTGCGIQALLLARHCDRVIATDVSARALRLAELGARLNGVDSIEFRSGSLLEPLTEQVDLLVSNPPFVITPRTATHESLDTTRESSSSGPTDRADGARDSGLLPDFEYRDGGMTGDRLVRTLVTSIPAALRPGGRSVCLGNWEIGAHTAAEESGPHAWITDPAISVLVIEREALDPIAYAETWIRDGGIPRASEQWNRATAAWIDDLDSREVAEIVFGYVVMERNDNDFRTFEAPGAVSPGFKERVRITSAPTNAGPGIGAFVQTVFELRSWLSGVDAEEMATTAFTRSPDLVEHRHLTPGESDPASITLEQGLGFGQVFDLDTALAGFVSVADGTLTLRQTAVALAHLLEVDAAALEEQLIMQVRQLVAAGALLPTGDPETGSR
ncbi:methyltransferase family protein [Brevibacterium sanguinis]|uniref:Methyltransferase family protein n=2 Tax=Brevibacterium TaxID=1696 RepID=A0A366IEQ0_9MICO|nr:MULTISPECIES: class I SAM-dependent methyltransferase [Brevibacterium]RBP63385.1 methyltransferase family protein [Brevibacterium sanguinis]RBP69852.1 methyltransferase family protein [Brevibacterium celere]